jgi:glycosyltransferase involved in cell wall biosynthesis
MLAADSRIAPALDGASLLIIGVNYWPETTGIAPYTTRFAEHLAAAGAGVRVVTAQPHYPSWKLFDGCDKAGVVTEQRNGVAVSRVRPRVPARMTAASRALFEASFAWRARAAVPATGVDAIIAVVPSLAGAALGALTARRRNIPFGIIFQDLMGRSAEQSGMSGKGIAAITSAVERRLATAADRVGVVATGFSSFLESAGVQASRLQHLPNWCHIHSTNRHSDLVRRRLGWANDCIVVLHAGNMGAKQALENVIEAARVAESIRSDMLFVLMGDGSRRRDLEATARGAANLQFLDPQPADAFPDVLAAADVLLVNERATVRDMSLPSKLTSYFSAGRPVIAAVRSDGTTAAEVQRSGGGEVVPPGDARALVDAIAALVADPTRAAALGARGRKYASEYLGEEAAADRSVAFAAALLGRSS